MSALYFCTFLHLYFVRTVNTKFYAKYGVSISKNERVMLNLVISAVTLIHQSRLYLKASRQGHLLHRQISPVPDVSQISFTPQNVAIDQGINLRVVSISQDSLGRSYCRQSRPQQIFSFYFSPNLSKSDVDATTDSQIHRHLDIQRRPILCMGRLKSIYSIKF